MGTPVYRTVNEDLRPLNITSAVQSVGQFMVSSPPIKCTTFEQSPMGNKVPLGRALEKGKSRERERPVSLSHVGPVMAR